MRFFVLQRDSELMHRSDAPTEYYHTQRGRRDGAPRCGQCGQWIGSLRSAEPVEIDVELQDQYYGDIGFGAGDEVLVSRRAMELFQSEGITPWDDFKQPSVRHYEFHGPAPTDKPPDYLLAAVRVGNAALDEHASRVIRDSQAVCPQCRIGGTVLQRDAIILEQGSWAGEHLFIARGLPGTFLASEHFVDVVARHGLRNFVFVPAASCWYNSYGVYDTQLKVRPRKE